MAYPTAVNSQITDAVTQSNVEVVANAPAMAMGNLYQTVSQSLSLSAQNAVNNQQSGNTLAQAVTTKCVEALVNNK